MDEWKTWCTTSKRAGCSVGRDCCSDLTGMDIMDHVGERVRKERDDIRTPQLRTCWLLGKGLPSCREQSCYSLEACALWIMYEKWMVHGRVGGLVSHGSQEGYRLDDDAASIAEGA